jgi:Uma2 family endonuclease
MPTLTSAPKAPPEQRVMLNHVSWETYERLLAENRDASAPRLTYDQGALEIMSPSAEHERLTRTLATIAELVAEESGVEFEALGSTTFRRPDLERGTEPDACFYLQNANRIRGKREIDLAIDPPPDLIIEVAITNPALDKLSIYARLGIPEIWRCDGKEVKILRLSGNKYEVTNESDVLTPLTQAVLSEFLSQSKGMTTLAWRRRLRDWGRDRRK